MNKVIYVFKRYTQKIIGFEYYLFISSLWKYRLIKYDKRENDIFHFLNLVPNNGIILDIGANVGVMTKLMAKKKPNAQIHSFEPIPQNYANIEKIIKRDKLNNVSLYKTALGNSEGTVKMIMPVIKHVLYEGLTHVANDEQEQGLRFDVQIKRLDDILNDKLDAIKAIKIDVENFEFEVFSGASKLLEKSHPIIYCELMDNDNRKNVLELLSKYGYKSHVVENNELVHKTYYTQKHLNFIFS